MLLLVVLMLTATRPKRLTQILRLRRSLSARRVTVLLLLLPTLKKWLVAALRGLPGIFFFGGLEIYGKVMVNFGKECCQISVAKTK